MLVSLAPSPFRFVLAVNCSNVVVSDFMFDILPLPYTAASVVDASPEYFDNQKQVNARTRTLLTAADAIAAPSSSGYPSSWPTHAGAADEPTQYRPQRFPLNVTVQLVPGHPLFESVPAFSTYGIAEVMTPAERSVGGHSITTTWH